MSINYVDVAVEQVAASNTSVYTCPSSTSAAIIFAANCTNEEGTASNITVNIVQSGDTAAVTNQYISAKNIAANGSDSLAEIHNLILKPSDFISVIAGDADRLNLKLAIKEIS